MKFITLRSKVQQGGRGKKEVVGRARAPSGSYRKGEAVCLNPMEIGGDSLHFEAYAPERLQHALPKRIVQGNQAVVKLLVVEF